MCTLNFQLFWVNRKSKMDLQEEYAYLVVNCQTGSLSKVPLVSVTFSFLIRLFVFFRTIALSDMSIENTFSLICDLCFHSLTVSPQNRVFNFNEIQLTKSLFDVPLVVYLKSHHQTQGHKFSPYVIFYKLYNSHFTLIL